MTVDIAAGTATGSPGDPSVGTDTFSGVNVVRGSQLADTLLGSNNPAFSQPEVFEGRGGNDFIDGRGGFDRAIYEFRTDDNVTGGITVNLAAGTVAGDASIGTDTLRSIEAVRGTDLLTSSMLLDLRRRAPMPVAPERLATVPRSTNSKDWGATTASPATATPEFRTSTRWLV